MLDDIPKQEEEIGVCRSFGYFDELTIPENINEVAQGYFTWDLNFYRSSYSCIPNPTCDDNQTLDTNTTPPTCVDNPPVCEEEDTSFPALKDQESIIYSWSPPEDLSGQCTSVDGDVQKQKVDCIDNYRCTCPYEAYPPMADNEKELFTWAENSTSDRSNECSNLGGKKTQSRVACTTYYRCSAVTEEAPKEDPECISSYVNPRNQSFHEDITITGTDFGLHYASGNIETNQTQTIAYGWHFSNHAKLEDDTLTLGDGTQLIVEPSLEEDKTVVSTGSSELLFDAEKNHIQTRDLYTKEVESTFGYDASGNLTSITNRFAETTTLNRDANGTLTSITAPHGQTTYLAIDSHGDLVGVQYEDTSSYTFEYEKHLMTLEREPKGNAFLHFFDTYGNVIKVIDAEQGEWDFGTTTDTASNTHTVTRAGGDVITYQNHFLEDGLLKTTKTLPNGEVILYAHRVDDSYNSTTTCGMQSENSFRTNPDGSLYKDPIKAEREVASSTLSTPSGLIQTTYYTTNHAFDANGSLISVTNTTETNGATTTSLRDYNQSRLTLTSPEGRVSTTTYNANQQPIKTQIGTLKPTKYKYDNKGRLIQTKQGKRIMRYTYNDKGNVSESHNIQRDTKTTYTYDLLDRVVQTTYDDGTTEHFAYDANGNLVTRTVPTPADHTFSYNGVNKRTDYTSPLQKATTYTYDKQRRITKVTKPSTKSIDTTYTNGRVTAITTPEGVTTYSYDCQSNITNIAKPSTGSGTDESLSFTYDGSLLTSMTQSGQLTQTLSYTYNNDFRVAGFTYAGRTESHSYDKDGLLLSVGALANAPYTLTRDAQNGLTTNITDGTLDMNQSYNAFGELKTQKSQNFKLRLARQEGRIAKKVEKVVDYYTNAKGKTKKRNTKTTHTYSYDERDRLIEVKEDNVTIEAYTYDANGNRASATINGVTTTASYTLDDNLIVYGQHSYQYDEDGYLQEKVTPEGTTTYIYGTLGELISVNTPSQSVTYTHNANNQRVAKLVNGIVVEKYLWANLTTLLAIYDANDNLLQRFEYAESRMPLSMTDINGIKYYLHYDQVGSLRAVSNATHNILKEITYDTYGNIVSDSNTSFKVPFGFAGGLYDSDTKLTRFGYRDYDAYTGKWTAKDPIGFDGGDSNLYGYVLGDPVGFVDPEGLLSAPAAGAIGGGFLGFVISFIDPCTGKVQFQGWSNLAGNTIGGAAFGALALSVSSSTVMGLGSGVGISYLSSLFNYALGEPCKKEDKPCP